LRGSASISLIPSECVIRFSGASSKALAYFGGADPNTFKGKIIYIPEAVFFTDRHGVESEFTIMLRTLISEGRIVYSFVSVREGQDPVTVTIVKNGPIAAVITTARDVRPGTQNANLSQRRGRDGRADRRDRQAHPVGRSQAAWPIRATSP
jgi:hypothetical protein